MIGQAWQRIRARPGLGVTVAIVLIILLGLGTWQLTRLGWKTALIADLARSEAIAPIPLTQALALGKDAAWRRVEGIDCAIDPSQVVYVHAIKDGVAGYHLVGVCPVTAAPALVVDLGFSESRLLVFAPRHISLSGRLRPLEAPGAFAPPNNLKTGDWYTRSLADLKQRFGQDLRGDYFLVCDLARSSINIDGLSQGPITAELPNRHLEYALTWYGLALVMLGFYAVMISRPQPLKNAA